MPYDDPTTDDFKAYFRRDFPYSQEGDAEDRSKVCLDDIQRAIEETARQINEELSTDQDTYTVHFLYLAAHNLVMNLRASSQGWTGQFGWLQTSKGVGGVSEAQQIPQRILDNPELAMLTKTNYGAKYLFMVLPQLAGNIFTAAGWSKP